MFSWLELLVNLACKTNYQLVHYVLQCFSVHEIHDIQSHTHSYLQTNTESGIITKVFQNKNGKRNISIVSNLCSLFKEHALRHVSFICNICGEYYQHLTATRHEIELEWRNGNWQRTTSVCILHYLSNFDIFSFFFYTFFHLFSFLFGAVYL